MSKNLTAFLLKQLQPTQRECLGNRLCRADFVGCLAPVEANPAGSVLLRPVDELLKLVGTAFQDEGFFNDHRLAYRRKSFHGLNGLGHLSLLGIDVHGDEVEIVSDLLGDEPGSQAGPIQTPRHKADCDQMPLVVLANRRRRVYESTSGQRLARFRFCRSRAMNCTKCLSPNPGPSQSSRFLSPPGTTGSFMRS